MSRPGCRYLLLLVLAAAISSAGCAEFVRPCDEMAVWLDHLALEPPKLTWHDAERTPQRGRGQGARRVQLAQHEEAIPTPVDDQSAAEPLGTPPLAPEFPAELVPAPDAGPMLIEATPATDSSASLRPAQEAARSADSGLVTCGCGVGECCPHCPIDGLMCGDCPLADCELFHPPPPGPPPVRYAPEMPPQFLLVPTGPVVPTGRTGPVELPRGNVERGFRPQLTVMGRD